MLQFQEIKPDEEGHPVEFDELFGKWDFIAVEGDHLNEESDESCDGLGLEVFGEVYD